MKAKKSVGRVMGLFTAVIFYKLMLEYVFWKVLQLDTTSYRFDFNSIKYANGFFWCFILFFMIRHTIKKVSTFILIFEYLIAIVPLTVIYALGNNSPVFYNLTCFSFWLIELYFYVGKDFYFGNTKKFDGLIKIALVIILLFLLTYLVKKGGMPSLKAFDFLNIYEFRLNNSLTLHKYTRYILDWSVKTIIPFLLADALINHRKTRSILCIFSTVLLFLYTGHKTYFFSIVLILTAYYILRKGQFYARVIYLTCYGLGILSYLATLSETLYLPFSFLVRRTLFVPANIKFLFYDFFKTNTRFGFSGTLLGKIFALPNPYEKNIGYIIGETYFNAPEMEANTGFLAEGYLRFGVIGIFLLMFLFLLVLIFLDQFQQQVGYEMAILTSLYPVFCLNDGYLLSSIMFGHMTVFLFIILFYRKHNYGGNRKCVE